MLKKKNYLLLALIFTVNSVNAGVVDKNERLKALLEKAKARESGAPVETTSTSPTPATTPINPKPISSSPVNNPIPDFKPIPTTSPSATKPSEVPVTKTSPVAPKPTVTPVRERTPLQSRAEKSETIAPSPEPVRAPRILSTHPQQEAKPVEKPKAPEPSPQASPNQVPKIEIKQETKVIQPPVNTLINPQPAPIRTQTNSNSQIKQKAKEENNLINDKTNTATPKNSLANNPLPNPSSNSNANKNTDVASNYDDVLKSIDAIMKGTKVEEMKAPPVPVTPKPSQEANPTPQFSNQTKTPTVSPTAAAPTKAAENKPVENKITPPAQNPVAATNAVTDKASSPTAETATAATATTATGKEADYLLVLNKSVKSLEQDSWINVKTNMQEAVSYFEKEKKFNPKNPKLATYSKIILGFQRFGEAGMELDQGDLADFEEAEALYLDCQDNLEEANKELANDPSNQEVKNIITKVLQYTEEELNYIEEMLGM